MFIIFVPLVQLIVSGLVDTLRDPGAVGLAIPTGRRFSLLLNSFGLASMVTISVVIIGILAGSHLISKTTGIWRLAGWAFILTIPVPPYVHALTWTSTMIKLNDLIGSPGFRIPISGFFPSYCVNVLAYLPLAVGLVIVGLWLVESEAVEAARLMKNDFKAYTEVLIPLAKPMISAALGLVFILVITDFSVPTLYSYNVYSLEVFSEFSASNSATSSLLLSLPTLIATFTVLSASIRGLRATVQSSSVGNFRGMDDWVLPWWVKAGQLVSMLLCLSQLVLLLGGLVMETGSIQSIFYALSVAPGDIWTTAVISALGAVFGTLTGYLISERLENSDTWWILVSLPLALPPALVGIGLIQGYNTWLPIVYGTMAMPVLAVTTRFVSLGAIIVYSQRKKIDNLLFEAADLFEKKDHDALWKIKLRLQRNGIVSALLIIFAFSLGELGATLLVVPPGRETLTIRIFNYLHYGASQEVAGLCLILVVVMMVMSGVAFQALRLGWGIEK